MQACVCVHIFYTCAYVHQVFPTQTVYTFEAGGVQLVLTVSWWSYTKCVDYEFCLPVSYYYVHDSDVS